MVTKACTGAFITNKKPRVRRHIKSPPSSDSFACPLIFASRPLPLPLSGGNDLLLKSFPISPPFDYLIEFRSNVKLVMRYRDKN
ncbi:hypothetical protein JCM15764A_30140 [Geotalea toluenoxydans]